MFSITIANRSRSPASRFETFESRMLLFTVPVEPFSPAVLMAELLQIPLLLPPEKGAPALPAKAKITPSVLMAGL
jgi:hypothetical protein